MSFKLIFGLILAGMAAFIIIQNAANVEVTLFFWALPISSTLLMFLILSIGIIMGWLLRGSLRNKKAQPV